MGVSKNLESAFIASIVAVWIVYWDLIWGCRFPSRPISGVVRGLTLLLALGLMLHKTVEGKG